MLVVRSSYCWLWVGVFVFVDVVVAVVAVNFTIYSISIYVICLLCFPLNFTCVSARVAIECKRMCSLFISKWHTCNGKHFVDPSNRRYHIHLQPIVHDVLFLLFHSSVSTASAMLEDFPINYFAAANFTFNRLSRHRFIYLFIRFLWSPFYVSLRSNISSTSEFCCCFYFVRLWVDHNTLNHKSREWTLFSSIFVVLHRLRLVCLLCSLSYIFKFRLHTLNSHTHKREKNMEKLAGKAICSTFLYGKSIPHRNITFCLNCSLRMMQKRNG